MLGCLKPWNRTPDLVLEIDLEDQRLRVPGRDPIPFAIESFARNCLLCGVDELGYLLSRNESIDMYEQRMQARVSYHTAVNLLNPAPFIGLQEKHSTNPLAPVLLYLETVEAGRPSPSIKMNLFDQ